MSRHCQYFGSFSGRNGDSGCFWVVLALGELCCPSRLAVLEKVTDGSDTFRREKGYMAGTQARIRCWGRRDLAGTRGKNEAASVVDTRSPDGTFHRWSWVSSPAPLVLGDFFQLSARPSGSEKLLSAAGWLGRSSPHVVSRGPQSTAFSLAGILNFSVCSGSPREGHQGYRLFHVISSIL